MTYYEINATHTNWKEEAAKAGAIKPLYIPIIGQTWLAEYHSSLLQPELRKVTQDVTMPPPQFHDAVVL